MKLSEMGEKLLREQNPGVKMQVASGAFPIHPRELIYIVSLYALGDRGALREQCTKTLKQIPRNIVIEFLKDRELDPRVFFILSFIFQDDMAVLEQVLLHPAVPDKILETFSKSSDSAVLKVLLHNEEKWTKNERIVENLFNNRALPPEFYEKLSFYIPKHLKESIETGVAELHPDTHAEFKAYLGTEEEKKHVHEHGEVHEHGHETESDEESKRSLAGKISKLSVAEKIKLGMLGNKEVRNVLIKDSNKLVSTAVVKNPRMTEGEIVKITQDRNISEEIIRIVANDRNWTQSYTIKVNLVQHPKTPAPLAIRFLPSLSVKDLASVAKNKNVSSVISTTARKIAASRSK